MDTEDASVLFAAVPATAYREYLYRPQGPLAHWIDDRYEVVARPGQRIGRALQYGDVLLEVTLGQMSRGRCATLMAGDLELVASWPRLPQGHLLLRPRRRVEMSEPLPVEPSAYEVLAASGQLASVSESTTGEGTPEAAFTGTSATPATGAMPTPLAPLAPGAGARQDGMSTNQPVNAEEGADSPAKKVNEYQPDDAATLVINMASFDTGITGIRNYKDWRTDASVPHNKRYNGYRTPTDIIQIVLHETSADFGYGFSDKKNETAHLAVQRNGTIKQFNDLVEYENHTIGLNPTSIGIEFVNRDWLSSTTKDGGEGIPAHEAALTADQKAKYAEAKGHIWTFWGYGFGIYKLPPADLAQLEKEVELLSWLTDSLQATINSAPPQFQSMFPWFEKTWLQLVSYNDVKDKWTFPADHIPAAADQATKNLFVYTTGWDVLLPAQISGKRGIISHNATYDGHPDGSFLALYTWLRMAKGKTGQQAFDLCKSLMKNHWIRVRPKSNSSNQVIVLDVSDHNLQNPGTAVPGEGAEVEGEGQAVGNSAVTQVDGIDVHFAVPIPSWGDLTQAGIRFMFLRCSEQQAGGALVGDTDAHVVTAGSAVSSSFPRRWADAGANNVMRGAYHFYRYNVGTATAHDGGEQAQMVASMVGRLLPGDLAPALDFEGLYLVTALAGNEPGAVALRDDLDLFLDGVETRLGRTPWIYTAYFPIHDHITSKTDFVASDFTHLSGYPLWVKVYPYATADTAYRNRFTIDPTNISPPSNPSFPTDWVPSMWNDDWAVLQYLGDKRPSQMASFGFSTNTDWNITRQGIYVLRGLADLGHTAPHVVGSQSFIAHVEKDGHVHVRTRGTPWTDEDVTVATSTPLAMGDVAAIGNGDQQVLLYRSRVNSHVIALSRNMTNSSGWNVVDVTAESAGAGGAVAALDDPLMIVVLGSVEAVHWGSGDHHSHLMTDTSGAWHGADLTENPAAPPVSGRAAIYRHQNVTRVVGRAGSDGHLVEFSRDGSIPLGTDLTATSTDAGGAHPPAATYRPSVYTPDAAAPRIVFRALRGDLWEIERDTLVARNLTAAAQAAQAAGSPSAVFAGGVMHTLYRTKDSRVIDLFATATGFASREVPCSVRAAADPTAYIDGGNVAVTYRGVDGTIHRAEPVNGAWTCEDTAP